MWSTTNLLDSEYVSTTNLLDSQYVSTTNLLDSQYVKNFAENLFLPVFFQFTVEGFPADS